ncbi:MAG TPA: hypothetical protein VFB55_13145 [Verrucomicrobiae bacterium]|jgi:hypothetical protein|nr:hypothetical protein [Verrucomicrobiae bacterium]
MNPVYCKHLRTKSLYVGATPEEAFADREGEYTAPCHFWCNRTQTAVGLDDRPVHKTVCVAGRACFEE